MPNLRVLHTLDSLNRGGAEMLTLDVCRNARNANLDLTFVATGGGDLEGEFRTSGAEFIGLQRRLPLDPILVRELHRIIVDRRIQIVHAQQAVEAMHLYLATRGTGAYCVMSLQAYILDRKNRIATRLITPRMDRVCPVSQSMQVWYRDGEGFEITDKYRVLPNGVDPARLQPSRLPGTATLRMELGIDASATLLGMVGNFYPDQRKDQLTICRALGRILGDRNDVHFVFVGAVHDGAQTYFDKCGRVCGEAGIADRVHFLGKRGDVVDILTELDLFVFSSVQEGLPVAAIEALMLGVPMIVSDIPPLLEVTGLDGSGRPCAAVFKTGDADDLAEKVTRLLQDQEELKRLGRLAKVEASKRFGIDSHLQTLRDIYRELI
ncbi:MAG: glycosyltransferase family 4 protein [Pyrinomonadaceae bacterium]